MEDSRGANDRVSILREELERAILKQQELTPVVSTAPPQTPTKVLEAKSPTKEKKFWTKFTIQKLSKILLTPVFVSLLVFIILIIVFAVTSPKFCCVPPTAEGENSKLHWGTIITISGVVAGIVLIVPYIIKWKLASNK